MATLSASDQYLVENGGVTAAERAAFSQTPEGRATLAQIDSTSGASVAPGTPGAAKAASLGSSNTTSSNTSSNTSSSSSSSNNNEEIITAFHLAMRSAALVVTPGMFGNQSITQAGQNFESGAQTAGSFGAVPDMLRAAKAVGGFIPAGVLGLKKDLPYDDKVVSEIQKVSGMISTHANMRYEHAEDFIYILSTIDDLELMGKIADAVQIPELMDENMLCNPMNILSIPSIRDCAYLADAVSGLNRAFGILGGGLQNGFDIKPTAASLTGLMGSITGALGIAQNLLGGAAPNAGAAGMMLGLNLSKMLLGKEIPIGVQSNNPMLRAPSIIGKMMFGENKNGTHCFDTNQYFAKPIAVFGDMTGGAGTSSFMMKMAPSLSSPQPLTSLMAGALSGFSSAAGSFSSSMMSGMTEQITGALGCKATDVITGAFADNAIPFQSAMANSMASLSSELPKLSMEMRDSVEALTSNVGNIDGMISKMVNMQQAASLGLPALSQSAAQIKQLLGEGPAKIFEDQMMSKITSFVPPLPNIVPPAVFQAGWNQMASARQALGGANKMFAQAEFLVKTLG